MDKSLLMKAYQQFESWKKDLRKATHIDQRKFFERKIEETLNEIIRLEGFNQVKIS